MGALFILVVITAFCALCFNTIFFIKEYFTQSSVITVNFTASVDTVKDLLGGNRGKSFDPNTIQIKHDEGIKFIRTHDFHGILDYSDYSDFWNTDGLGHDTINLSFNPYDPSDYHWNVADSIIDLIVSNNFKIFFRLGVSYPNPTIFPLAPTDPPCDDPNTPYHFFKFASLCKQTYKHYCEGWDNGYYYDVDYWEIWNEPGYLFWTGNVNQFYSMYKTVVDTLKSYAPGIKIGALGALPETARGENPQYREDFINNCAQYGLPLDFYSWHLYSINNPYAIKLYADTIRTILDSNGYTQAESIISEINNTLSLSLDSFAETPYGAAYYLSIILTAQEAPIDKLLWYPSGVGIVNQNRTRTTYGMTFFHLLQENTPIEVSNDGNEVVEGHYFDYEDNFMVLSAKSSDNNKLYILISNLQSNNTMITLNLENLPWTTADSVKITKTTVSDQYVCDVEEGYMQGSNTMNIDNQDCPNPGILFYRIEKISYSTNIDDQDNKAIAVYPNSSTGQIYLKNVAGFDIHIFDDTGKLIMSKTNNNKNILSIDLSKVTQGIYFVECYNGSSKKIFVKKILITADACR